MSAPSDPAAGSSATHDEPATITQRNLPLLLLTARERVISRFRPILNSHGVTEQQWRIVRALLEMGPQEPRQISETCRISSPSLAGVLARMDDMGLVQRERLAHDQRRVMVSLTDASRTLAARMAPQIEATYAGLSDSIGAERLQLLYQLLDEVIGLLSDSAEGDGSVSEGD